MREATSGLRQLDKLRKSLDAWQERKKMTQETEGQKTEGQAIYQTFRKKNRGTGHLSNFPRDIFSPPW